ncbi:MAG: DUF3048 C-terminal domain-containing protein [Anaerolineae bacterium]|jgi:hypothetical protein|nr:DUF3048 C-terminal domain-containing protein [Anaerolineae bacterium]
MQQKREKIVKRATFIGFLITALVIVVVLWGLGSDSDPDAVADVPPTMEIEPSATMEPTEDLAELLSPTSTTQPEPTLVPTETQTEEPTPTAEVFLGPFGPNADDFPAGMSMLTGQMVADPDTLDYPPAMVSVTNWPVNARPQPGLGSASIVYELYIGEGMSRFLTLFYGDYPEPVSGNGESGTSGVTIDNSNADSIGPIRSGRLPYESIRNLNNGFLVMASAYAGVAQNLENYTNVYGSDGEDINSAKIPVDQLKEIAKGYEGNLVEGALSGNIFDDQVPAGGVTGDTFWFIYNSINQIAWQFDPATGTYYRYADLADGTQYRRLVDGMTGENVDISNVVLLYANHRYCNYKAFQIDFYNISAMPAVLFRDGQKYDIQWTTANTDFELETGKRRPIRFIDEAGNPFPLKPGATWIILAPMYTPIWESEMLEEIPLDAIDWLPEEPAVQFLGLLNKRLDGTGVWVSRFYQDLMIYDGTVCAQID